MSYTPLKKEIVFSDEIKNNPYYNEAMRVIKSLGDKAFRQWLIEHIYSTAELPSTHASDQTVMSEGYDELKAIGVTLEALVSREVTVDALVIENCKKVFLPALNVPVITLLCSIMGFLLNVQNFERMIIKIDNDINDGNIPKSPKHLTRDGTAPVHLPRSMQTTKKYGS